jgi:hypothetical protein
LRLLRSLTPGYFLSPFQGWESSSDVFYRAKPFRSVEMIVAGSKRRFFVIRLHGGE